MKFYCDACNTKYAISDEKVRGKVLKVRCKHCGNVITVREMRQEPAKPVKPPATPPMPPPVKAPKVPQTNWYYAINGETDGPYQLAALQSKYASGAIGDETYVWHDTFDSWKPAATVSIFAAALKQGANVKPRFQTMGYTGPVQAVKAVPSAQTAGAVPSKKEAPSKREQVQKSAQSKSNAQQIRTPEAKPRNPLDEFKKRPSSNAKLERLRRKLEEESEVEDTVNEPASNEPATAGGAVGVEPMPLPTNPAAAEPVVSMFNTIPDTTSDPGDPGASDLIGQAIGFLEESESEVGLDFPSVPELHSEQKSYATDQPASNSLLIQLDSIKKTGRKRRWVWGLAIFLLLGAVASAAVAAYILREPEKTEVVKKDDEERKLVIPKYSKDEQNKFAKLELAEEVLANVTGAELEEMIREEAAQVAVNENENETEIGPETVEPKPVAKEDNRPTIKAAKSTKTTKTSNTSKTTKTEAKSEKKVVNDILAPRATINRPEDKLVSGKKREGLSREDAQRGFRKISHAVSICRERHQSRSGKPLKTAKVKLTVDVNPNGRVSKYSISPNNLRNTAFDSCLKSKRDTWRFAKFGGKTVQIKRTFVLE